MTVAPLVEYVLSVGSSDASGKEKPGSTTEHKAFLWSLRTPASIQHTFKQCATNASGSTAVKAIAAPARGRRISHFFTSFDKKPVLHVHQFSKEAPVAKWVIPEPVGPLAASPDGQLLAAAASQKGALYLWQLNTGKLLRVISHAHAQPIKCLAWSQDGLALVTGGADGAAHTWLLYALLDNTIGEPTPAHTMQHAKAITTLLIDAQPYTLAKVFTFDENKQCRITHLATGVAAAPSLLLPATPTAAVLSSIASHLYIGMANGDIHVVALYSKPQMIQPVENSSQPIFRGHKGAVRALTMSYDSALLVSGGEDGDVRIWDVQTYQTIQTCTHHGHQPVTNLSTLLAPHILPPVAEDSPLVPLERIIATDIELASGIVPSAVKTPLQYIEDMESRFSR